MIAPVLGRKPACTCVYDARSASRLLVCSQRARQSSTAPSPPSSLHYSSLAQAATSSSHSSMHCWSSCWQAPSKALWCCLCYCPFSSLRRTWPCGRLQRKGRRMAGAAHQHLRTVQGCNQWTTAVVQSLLLVKGQTRRQQRTPERPEGSSMRARAWCARAARRAAELPLYLASSCCIFLLHLPVVRTYPTTKRPAKTATSDNTATKTS